MHEDVIYIPGARVKYGLVPFDPMWRAARGIKGTRDAF